MLNPAATYKVEPYVMALDGCVCDEPAIVLVNDSQSHNVEITIHLEKSGVDQQQAIA